MNFFRCLPLLALVACTTTDGTTPPEVSTPKSATFQVRQEFKLTIPDGAMSVRAWLAMPQEDPLQDIRNFQIESPVPHRIVTDSQGNRTVHVEISNPTTKEYLFVETFEVTRREQRSSVDPARAVPLTDAERISLESSLAANEHVVLNDEIRSLAREVVGEEKNPVLAARRIYDWVLAHIEYWVKDPKNKKASPVGSTTHCLSTKTGNCTDFHSLWTSLARAAGIPTRMIYGSFFKKELDGQNADQSYHCWPEFYASGIGWIPHDVAVADIFVDTYPLNADNEKLVRLTTADGYAGPDASKVEYYFGNIDERRVTWSKGRDLMLTPAAGPVNALPKAYVEVDGKPAMEKTVWTRKLTYRQSS